MMRQKRGQKRKTTDADLVGPLRKRSPIGGSASVETDDCSLDCSDDELPPAFNIPEDDDKDIKINDLVWAKWKALYWPAIVMKLNPKKKKIGILFVSEVDVPQCYWLGSSNVLHYGSSKRSAALRHQQCKDPEYAEKLRESIDLADDYIRKQLLRIGNFNIDPIDFFRSPTLYCVNRPAESKDVDGAASDASDKEPRTPALNAETCHDLPTNEQTCSDAKPQISEAHTAKLEELISTIKGSVCKEHLHAILSGKLKNRRHRMFFSPASKRKKLKFIAGFGPFGDHDECVEAIYTHLTNLLTEKISKPYPFDPVMYVFDVWIPEAILFALQKVFGFNTTKAKHTFQNRQSIVDIMDARST